MTERVPLRELNALLRGVLRLDPDAMARTAQIAPCRLGLRVEGLGWNLILSIDADEVRLEPWPEPRADLTDAELVEVDVELTGAPVSLLRVALNPNDESLLLGGQVRLRGDAGKLQALRVWLAELDFDLEERLAAISGDIVAHQVGNLFRRFGQWAKRAHRDLSDDLGEFLIDEAELLPSAWEVGAWARDVDAIRDDVARAQARIAMLEALGAGRA